MKMLQKILLCLSLFGLTACGSRAEKAKEVSKITFTDALDRTVTLEEEPKKVAALLGSFADIWTLAGGTLCAAPDDAWEDFGLEMDAVHLGGAHSPSLEVLLSSDPDFVLASASTTSNVDMQEALEGADIPVAYFDVDHFDDYLEMLDICTDITKRKDLYEKNGLKVQKKIEEIKQKYQKEKPSDQDQKILLIRTSASSIKAKGSQGTILGEMLADLGCNNIADSDKSLLENLSLETIIRENPSHIFVVTMGNDEAAAKASFESMTRENLAWSSLEAVKSGRVHVMDKALFNLKPNDRWAESYQVLYETLVK